MLIVVSLTLTEASLMMVVVQVSLMTVIYKCNMFIVQVTGEFHGTTAADAMKITDEFYPLLGEVFWHSWFITSLLGCPNPRVCSTKAKGLVSQIPEHSRLTGRIGSSNPGDLSIKSLVWVIQILESGDLNHRICLTK